MAGVGLAIRAVQESHCDTDRLVLCPNHVCHIPGAFLGASNLNILPIPTFQGIEEVQCEGLSFVGCQV